MTADLPTREQIEELRRLEAAATKGPWSLLKSECLKDWPDDDTTKVPFAFIQGPHYYPDPEATYWRVEDAELAVFARNCISQLLTAAEQAIDLQAIDLQAIDLQAKLVEAQNRNKAYYFGKACFSCGEPWREEIHYETCDMAHREHWGHEWVSQRERDLTAMLHNANQRSKAAEANNKRLRIRLLSAAGDDLCRLSQDEIKELTSGAVQIPPKAEFLASCERFHEQIAAGPGVLSNCLTLAQLIAENEKLSRELAQLKAQQQVKETTQ